MDKDTSRFTRTRQLDLLAEVERVFSKTPPEMLHISEPQWEGFEKVWSTHRKNVEEAFNTHCNIEGVSFAWNANIETLVDRMAEDYLQTFYWRRLSEKEYARGKQAAQRIYSKVAVQRIDAAGDDIAQYTPPNPQDIPEYVALDRQTEDLYKAQQTLLAAIEAKTAHVYLQRLQEAGFGLDEAAAVRVLKGTIGSIIRSFGAVTGETMGVEPKSAGFPAPIVSGKITDHSRVSEEKWLSLSSKAP